MTLYRHGRPRTNGAAARPPRSTRSTGGRRGRADGPAQGRRRRRARLRHRWSAEVVRVRGSTVKNARTYCRIITYDARVRRPTRRHGWAAASTRALHDTLHITHSHTPERRRPDCGGETKTGHGGGFRTPRGSHWQPRDVHIVFGHSERVCVCACA